jgi:hypothetical protein
VFCLFGDNGYVLSAMNKNMTRLIPLVLLVTIAEFSHLPGVSAQSDQAFKAVGYISAVDPQHNKLLYKTAGTTYVVDTRAAKIHLLAALQSAPETGDLVVGMRVEVDGSTEGGRIVDASAVQVLPYVAPPTPGEALPSTFRPSQSAPTALPTHGVRGIVSDGASFFSRNIKVNDGGNTIIVGVPRGIPVREGNTDISVHDLKKGMDVIVSGSFDGDQKFSATSIEADASSR